MHLHFFGNDQEISTNLKCFNTQLWQTNPLNCPLTAHVAVSRLEKKTLLGSEQIEATPRRISKEWSKEGAGVVLVLETYAETTLTNTLVVDTSKYA